MICPGCKGLKGWLIAENDFIKCTTCNGTGKYIDPYLIPGQVCKVQEKNGEKWYGEFDSFAKSEKPIFRIKHSEGITAFLTFSIYYPVGTEWDYAPDWAVCSTIDGDGQIYFWNSCDLEPTDFLTDHWVPSEKKCRKMCCGICPDKSRYENEAWKTSLRKRPWWAEVKK